MKKVAILGSTGSIGENTLRVIADNRDRFEVVALAAGSNWERLAHQAREFSPKLVSISNSENVASLNNGTDVKVLSGSEGLREVAAGVGADIVVSALVGAVGLEPTLAAIEAGAAIALANKEVLVMAGELVTQRASDLKVPILPIDSEHAGVAQLLDGSRAAHEVLRVILTASGGPFRTTPIESLYEVTPEEALRHPTWKMGPKVTIDSASMMNKGLELIEASWLFDLAPNQVDVLIHPESVVHALAEFVDGSMLAQMSVPDMRISISQALCYPDRVPCEVSRLDLASLGSLHFEEPGIGRFPCLTHARGVLNEGGTSPAVLNAANEIAVAAFLEKRIGFMDIPALVATALDGHRNTTAHNLDDILEADRWAREFTSSRLESAKSKTRS
ncbi:MAG: 1-deoxy-D-xylulose-5-phosphate reductoisomerase [Nitrospinaceae bacterium]|nr:1-deoxy-D-xylulose-5-phosphate reductoisomerase [Nitrospinaceae bacterium]MBT3432586.1 1-deoxy-D-xylulose-5-phosphate reductoisomerase [Nitrospinaceae bacterium]MBT3822098.1 1-deoxy-D-xylulose-5-phosphate reductoisomerase [Nitrospinaceae bacterium]MBT4095599.1 1-deoxy-D-xylulose-5-phosphate reductoisomerase [Nitrospinaceae bacterium]MBT4429666.1 1-deoxy-D-xylulose-5-phosphate reductoisomerase [Nitrospinaceae bacterium]